MLYGLQQQAAASDADWRSLEPAMDRLAELLAPDDRAKTTTVAGDDRWLDLGPVDLAGELIMIQRNDALIAGIARRDGGRLRVAAFQPLDATAANTLISSGHLPGVGGKVSMRDNNWECVLDASAGLGQIHSANAGLAYRSYWQYGLGVDSGGARVDLW